MKNYFFILVAAIASLMVVSCSVSVPDQITRLADKVDKKGDKYSLKDWEKAAEKMEQLVLEFADGYDTYKISEKTKVFTAVAKFSAKAVQCGASEILEEVDLEDALDDLSDSANNLMESAKGFLEGLGL